VPGWFLALLIVVAVGVAVWAHYRGTDEKASNSASDGASNGASNSQPDSAPEGTPDSASEGVAAVPVHKGLFDMAFTATTLDGKTFSTADHRGRVVLVNCFATWCPPCRVETPHLIKLYNERHGDGLDIVMVSNEPAERIEPFVKMYGVPYAVIPDGQQVMAMVPNLRGIPTTVILDRQGIVRRRITGAQVDEIIAAVDHLLKQ